LLLFFVPAYSIGSLSFNALTGIVVWEDWNTISSGIGYGSVFLLLLLGIFLMSDLNFAQHYEKIQEEEKKQARRF